MNGSPHPRERFNALAAVLAASIVAVSLFSNLGAVGLVGPDEPRYAWIARAMAATGDWVTPRLYGQPWFEKPILYYWTAAVGFLLRLPPEWAARLPSALAALAAAVAIGWLAREHYAPVATGLRAPALLAPLLFSTTVAAIGFARAATPDMLFSAFMALAMASAAAVFRRNGLVRTADASPPTSKSTDTLPVLLFGSFLGLAVLAKGPAAIVLAGGAIGLWALLSGRWRPVFRLAHPCAIATFCLVALPWYVLCELRNPDFIHIFIFEHNFERYLTPVFQHRQPFWFFGPITLLALLPWTVLLWPVVQEGLRLWREQSWTNSPGFFVACWAVFPVLFFTFSQSKLPGYILPSVPPLALLCALPHTRTIDKASSGRVSRASIGIAIGFTWVGLGLSAGLWAHHLPEAMRYRGGLTISMIALLVGIGLIFLALRRNCAFWGISLLLVALLVQVVSLTVLPRLDPFISARGHARLLHNDRHPDRIFAYQLPRSWNYGLAFYLGRELPEWSPADPNPALVLTTPAGLKEMRQGGRFYGDLDEAYQGILYVPIGPAPRGHPPPLR